MRHNKILSIIIFILLIHVAGAQTSGDWYNIGEAFSYSGEYNKASEAYDKAIDIDPNNAFAWNSKGFALNKLGENRRALEAYDKAIDIDPNFEYAWYNKGVSLIELGEYNRAIEAYERAIALEPNDASFWLNKGYALAKLGENRKALEAYDTAIAINPNFEEAWLNKGVAHMFLGEYSKSIEASSRGGTFGWIRVFVTISIGILFVAFVILIILAGLRKNKKKVYDDSSLPVEELRTARGDANQLKAQKSRITDFLSKLDERFINKELSDNNYKELKSKYENQLKDIEKQIVDAELHE